MQSARPSTHKGSNDCTGPIGSRLISYLTAGTVKFAVSKEDVHNGRQTIQGSINGSGEHQSGVLHWLGMQLLERGRTESLGLLGVERDPELPSKLRRSSLLMAAARCKTGLVFSELLNSMQKLICACKASSKPSSSLSILPALPLSSFTASA
eukprot:c45947_g1_i1 orf=2-454(-)